MDENNKVTVTPKASVLDGDDSAVIYGENLSGTTIQVKIPVYIDSKGNEGGSDASNQAVLEMIRAHGHFHTNENGTEDYMTFKNAAYTLVDDMIDERNTPGRMETDTVTTTVNCPQIADPEKFVSDKDDLNWDYSVEKGGEDKEELHELLDEVKELIENIQSSRAIPKQKKLFEKISNHMEKHGWFYGAVVQLLGTAALGLIGG